MRSNPGGASSASFVASSIEGGCAVVQLVVNGSVAICAAAARADLLAVGVAEVGAVEAGEPVDVAVAEIVVDVAAVAADEDGDVLRLEGHVGEMQHQVLLGAVSGGRSSAAESRGSEEFGLTL